MPVCMYVLKPLVQSVLFDRKFSAREREKKCFFMCLLPTELTCTSTTTSLPEQTSTFVTVTVCFPLSFSAALCYVNSLSHCHLTYKQSSTKYSTPKKTKSQHLSRLLKVLYIAYQGLQGDICSLCYYPCRNANLHLQKSPFYTLS